MPPCDTCLMDMIHLTWMSQVWIKTMHVELRRCAQKYCQPYFVATWTHNKHSICTIAMFLEAHVFSPYLSVYKTKVQWNLIGTSETQLQEQKGYHKPHGGIEQDPILTIGIVQGTYSSKSIYTCERKVAYWDYGSCGRSKIWWHFVGLFTGLHIRLTIL
jgi:hypothetical protein